MLESIITLVAVFALVGLNWWLGRTGRLGRDSGTASARLEADLIDFAETEGEAANDGKAYIAVGARAPGSTVPAKGHAVPPEGHATPAEGGADLAIAVARGDSWVTRRLGPGALRAVTRNDARLRLRIGDFTLPSVDLHFSDTARARYWEARLRELTVSGAKGQTAAPQPLRRE